MGDHTETVQVHFNEEEISLAALLDEFWANHNPNREGYKGRQYISLLLYEHEQQKHTMLEKKKEWETRKNMTIETEIAPLTFFTFAELKHQKYHLKKYKKATEQLKALYPTEEHFRDATVVARLNGFVKGFGTLTLIKSEIERWAIGQKEKMNIIEMLQTLKW